MMTVEFLVTSLIVVLIPGTGVVFTVSTGLAQGRGASVFAALGCTLGILPHLAATVLGLAAALHTSAVAFELLKYAGVAYLLYLAVATWRDRSAFAVQAVPSHTAARALVTRAFLLNILNPKLPLFFVAFLPQFLPAHGATIGQMVELGLGFSAMTFLTFVIYAGIAASGRRAILGSARVMGWMRRAFAASFAALGLRLAMERAA